MLRIPAHSQLRCPHQAKLSLQHENAQAEACVVVGDPGFSLPEHHPLVSNEDCLEGGARATAVLTESLGLCGVAAS
jgi:hypothetical protein